MNRIRVQSSNLYSVGYEAGILEIEFNSGGIYQYAGVPENIYLSLLNASSHGKFFHRYIKDRYRCMQIR